MKPAGGLIALFCILGLCACSSESRDITCLDDQECGTGELCINDRCIQAECRTDADCSGEQRCVDFDCLSEMTCQTNDDCLLGEICVEGACRPGCKNDRDCPAGFTCLPDEGANGKCAQCLADTDCNPGFICETHTCITGCRQDSDCPTGEYCQNDKCRAGCETDADCPDGFCHPGTHTCVECLQSPDCPPGQTCKEGRCVQGCVTDAGCPSGYVCRNNECVQVCSTRDDCDGPACVCKNETCTEPPPVCQGDDDCCWGYHCYFGTCYPDECNCYSDDECTTPEYPRCVDCQCVPECITDADCPLPGQVCVEHHCQSPDCTIETCPLGQWCDPQDGQCKRGCDQDVDCELPYICDPEAHQCVPPDCCGGLCQIDEYCDPLTCECVTICQSDLDCPTGFTCEEDGKCWCTSAACPPGTTCNALTGECTQDTCQTDADCPEGHTCNLETYVCEPLAPGKEGDACFADEECDTGVGLLCDSDLFCMVCMIEDPNFSPTFTCRFECSLMAPSCPIADRECKHRKTGSIGLCIPTE